LRAKKFLRKKFGQKHIPKIELLQRIFLGFGAILFLEFYFLAGAKNR